MDILDCEWKRVEQIAKVLDVVYEILEQRLEPEEDEDV